MPPNQTRSNPRAAAGRFGRTTPQSNRFARPGAAQPRRRPSVPSRPSMPGRPGRGRSTQRSPLDKAVQSVKGALPGTGGKSKVKTKRKSSSGGGRGKGIAGLAALAGAAGVALKNRDKLGGLVGKGGHDHDSHGEHHAFDQPGGTTTAPTPGAPGTVAPIPPIDDGPGTVPPIDDGPGTVPPTDERGGI